MKNGPLSQYIFNHWKQLQFYPGNIALQQGYLIWKLSLSKEAIKPGSGIGSASRTGFAS
jgi:hypothetical protein